MQEVDRQKATSVKLWPGVTVIIPAYNASPTLHACLESVAQAEYGGAVEVIVVDDRSTDETANIVLNFGCRLVRLSANSGPALARNAGAKTATGEILIFVDADTEMRRDTIRAAVDALTRDGVGAVNGMYEVEPINHGFFPTYYAYLKFHAFHANDADRMTAFSGQCGAIYKRLFEEVGGYRSITWGVDIENEEFGYRINQRSVVKIARDFRVRHNFPEFRKLLYVFTNRVYWWVLFCQFAGRHEAVLMTRGFGYATAAPTAAILCVLMSLIAPGEPWPTILLGASACLLGAFACGYLAFWRLCRRRRGTVFAIGSVFASVLFSFFITVSAARGYARTVIGWLVRRPLPFGQAVVGQV